MKTGSASTRKRPTDVHNAVRLLFLSLVLELLAFLFSGTYTTGLVAGIVVGAALTFFLMLRTNEGHNWARLGVTVLIVIGFVSQVWTFRWDFREDPGETVVDGLSTIITLIALVLLYTKRSNDWFARR